MIYAPWHYYDERPEHFFKLYEQLSFEEVHKSFLRFLPIRGANCLDIGAGSGRDAVALTRRGYSVIAVEPSDAMRELARKHHGCDQLLWLQDHLPDLNKVKLTGKKFEFILLSAVWMHIQNSDREHALYTLAHLLSNTGYLAMSIRIGPDSEERMMSSTNIEELVIKASLHNLHLAYLSPAVQDSLNRPEVKWKKVVFSKDVDKSEKTYLKNLFN